jgi:protein gp37
MADTRIEWASKVWNPVVGCSLASPGCTNCYAMRMAWRLQNMASRPDGAGNFHLDHYEGTVQQSNGGPVWTGKVNVAPDDVLLAPLRRKKPTDYFVNSMSDLFHPSVPFEVVDRVFAVMALTPQHTYKILTKRSARMREYLTGKHRNPQGWPPEADKLLFHNWPLSNVWLGVSVEDQRRADERIPDLLATPAAVRFISAEPLLGPINLRHRRENGDEISTTNWLHGTWQIIDGDHMRCGNLFDKAKLDWVIVGGESGPGARPMHPDWARSLRDQCAAANVPFLFKQWGEWAPSLSGHSIAPDGSSPGPELWNHVDTAWVNRIGKKRAGRLLDGVEHNGMPEVCP